MTRTATLAGLIALALAGCGGGTKTVVINNTTKTVVVPGGSTTAPGATTPRVTPATQFRKPVAGEGVTSVTGVVTNGENRVVSGAPSDSSQYVFFVVHPDQGLPLRIGAAGDLGLTLDVRETLADPACSGKVRGAFKVAPASYKSQFEYGLLTARIIRDDCH